MRIVVTGGAGFLGSHLIESLLEKGDEVICIDNFITGKKENIQPFMDKNFQIIESDVSNGINIDGPVDFIYHFASPASPADYLKYPIQTLKVGSLGTHNALGLAKEKKAKFMIASTSEVYGDPLINPQPEGYWGNVNPIGPRGVYDEAKRFAEALTMAYHRIHNIKIYILRIFNTYGPRMRLNDGRAIPNFFQKSLSGGDITIFGNGHQTRSFCYVKDLIEGILYLSESNYHLPVNLGNPSEMTIIELAETIIELTGSQSKIVFIKALEDDPKVRRPDITKARELLNWNPRTGLREGLIKTRDDFARRIEN